MHAPAYPCPACGGPQRHAGPGRCDLCGAAQGETEPPLDDSDLECPGCNHRMSTWPLDPQLSTSSYRGVDPQIQGCQGCGGVWVDRRTLEAIVAEAHALASNGDVRTVPRKTMAMADVVFYRPCPRCGERMNRRNFGRYSGVVVDECSTCGTFFDAGELEGVVAFVRAGGLTLTELRKAEEARRELVHRRQMNAAPAGTPLTGGAINKHAAEVEIELLIGFLRWLGRWIRWIRRIAD